MRSIYFLTVTVLSRFLLGFIFCLPRDVLAATEFVTVVKVFSNDDQGIIVRSNGDAYQIEKGAGCPSFWRYEGRHVLVSSPGLFLGAGSKLILPDDNQECRIWDSKEIGQWEGASTVQSSNSTRRTPSKPASRSCIDGHWVSSVSDNGQIVVLEDRSVWKIDAVDAIDTILWLTTDDVLICGSRMINRSNGEAVRATRLK